jgi:enterobactin synthetase component F
MEALVAEVFGAVFPDARIGPDSDFFDLGGDSVAAMQVVLHLEERLARPVHPSSLLHNPEVAQLAAALAAETAGTESK